MNIVSTLDLNPTTHLNVRHAFEKDEELLLKWANDPIVRSNGFNTGKISKQMHHKWFKGRLDDNNNCKFYIIETIDSIPIGQVRLDKKFGQWYINFSLADFARGKKMGTVLLEKIFDKFNESEGHEFIAEVKKGNIASCRVFEKIGFVKKSSDNNKIIFFYNLKKNFLVVGGGFGQMPAIKSAQLLKYNVVVVDRDPNGLGMQLADIPVAVDVLDVPSIIEIAKKYSVVGALTMQSDIGIPAVGAVVDELNLVGSGRKVAERCSNKIKMRKVLEKAGISQPKFKIVKSLDETKNAADQIGYPCVIKAPDSSASRGIVRANKINDIEKAFKEASIYSRSGSLIVEEFIDGLEFGAQAFSVEGKCDLILIHNDEMSNPPFMVPLGHSFPSNLPSNSLNKAKKIIKNCVEALGIKNGPSNIDLIFDKDENPKIIEVGARIGATCLPELVLYHTGIDFTKAAIEIACGGKPDLSIKKNLPCSAFILDSKLTGIMKNYKILEKFKNHPDILEWEVTAKPGDQVRQLKKGTDRIGKIVTKGSSANEAENLARQFRLAFIIDFYRNSEGN